MRLTDIRKWSADKIAHTVFYVLLALIVLMFGLFFLVGYEHPFEEDPEYNAPLLSGTLVCFTLVFILLTAIVWMTAAIISIKRRKKEGNMVNGIRSNRVSLAIVLCTSLILIITFIFGSSSPLIINGVTYQSAFWLKVADMFVYSIIAMLVMSIIVVAYGLVKGKLRR